MIKRGFLADCVDNTAGSVQCSHSVLQIRRGKRDNLGIIFHMPPLKRMLYH